MDWSLPLSAAIGGGSGLAGGLMANSANAKNAKKQMEFQYYMSNTAYRRAVRDMEKAGLNPILAAGAPASTPSGAMATSQNLGDAINNGVGAGVAARQAHQQIKLTKASEQKIQEETAVNAVARKIEEKAWEWLNREGHETERDMFYGAYLANRAGLPSEAGALFGHMNPGGAKAADRIWFGNDVNSAKAQNKRYVEELKEQAKQRKQRAAEGKETPEDVQRRKYLEDYLKKSWDVETLWPK